MVMPLALGALAISSALQIDGALTCPAPEQVATELAALSESAATTSIGAASIARARLEVAASQLRIEVWSHSGRLLGTRDLPASEECGQLARAAAVVITAFQEQLRAADVPAPTLAAELPVRPALPRWAHTLGLGALAALSGVSIAPGLAAEWLIVHRSTKLGFRAALQATALQSAPLASTTVDWGRYAIALGACYRLLPWRMAIDLHIEGLAALLSAGVTGPTGGQRQLDIDIGVGGGVRVMLMTMRPLSPFVGFAASYWPMEQTVSAPSFGVATLPVVELMLSAGLSIGPWD